MEQFPRHRDHGHLEDDVAAMAHDLGAYLHEFLLQAGQRPLVGSENSIHLIRDR